MSSNNFFHIILWWLLATAVSCSQVNEKPDLFPHEFYEPVYADGFEIVGFQDSLSRVIRIKTSWQGEDSTSMELFIRRGGEQIPPDFKGQVLENQAERIVAMSSSYVAMLDLIGKVSMVKGVSGLDYISNPYVNEHHDSIVDVGYDHNVDYEKLISIHPDMVLLYGINGSNIIETKLKSLGIPYLYMGEYLEPSPLGKVEWLEVLGELTGEVESGRKVFRKIEKSYTELKEAVAHTEFRPKVMLNVPYGDSWFMSSKSSAMAHLIEDAGADYIYDQNRTNRSVPIDLEQAFLLASEADYWLNVGQISSMDRLKEAYPKFSDVRSIREHRIYNCDKRTNAKGGNDFWESGAVRPDLVLEDLIRIFHPEILEEGTEESKLYYYRRLQ